MNYLTKKALSWTVEIVTKLANCLTRGSNYLWISLDQTTLNIRSEWVLKESESRTTQFRRRCTLKHNAKAVTKIV